MSGKILRKLREEKGMTQTELAKKLHVVRQTVSKWERELSAPDAGLLLRLAEALDVPASFLLGEEERVTEKRCMQCPTEEAEGSQASEIWHKPHGVPQKSGEVPAMQPSAEAEKESVQMPCDTRQELAAQLSCLQKAYARDCERRRRAVRTACTVFFVLATVIAVCALVSAWYTRDMTEALLHTPGVIGGRDAPVDLYVSCITRQAWIWIAAGVTAGISAVGICRTRRKKTNAVEGIADDAWQTGHTKNGETGETQNENM